MIDIQHCVMWLLCDYTKMTVQTRNSSIDISATTLVKVADYRKVVPFVDNDTYLSPLIHRSVEFLEEEKFLV